MNSLPSFQETPIRNLGYTLEFCITYITVSLIVCVCKSIQWTSHSKSWMKPGCDGFNLGCNHDSYYDIIVLHPIQDRWVILNYLCNLTIFNLESWLCSGNIRHGCAKQGHWYWGRGFVFAVTRGLPYPPNHEPSLKPSQALLNPLMAKESKNKQKCDGILPKIIAHCTRAMTRLSNPPVLLGSRSALTLGSLALSSLKLEAQKGTRLDYDCNSASSE